MLSGLFYLLTAAHEESSRSLSFIPSRSMCRLSFYRVGFFFTMRTKNSRSFVPVLFESLYCKVRSIV